MKTYNFEQRSLEWYAARAGVITASEIDALVSPLWKVRDGKGVDSYLNQKLAERWIGGAVSTYQSEAMEMGILNEEAARKYYERRYCCDVQRVGFITDDAGWYGCSPDGLLGEFQGLEVKCPTAPVHVGYLRGGVVPSEYVSQVQFSLYVTGRKSWAFLSYRHGFPAFILDVEPDPKAFAAFDAALPPFIQRLNESFDRIVELNGGQPDKNLFREELMAVPTEVLNASELDGDVIP
jgi:putative phage-type endonuclease